MPVLRARPEVRSGEVRSPVVGMLCLLATLGPNVSLKWWMLCVCRVLLSHVQMPEIIGPMT